MKRCWVAILKTLSVPIGIATVVLLVFAAWSLFYYGDMQCGLARLAGKSLVIEPYRIDLGIVTSGEHRDVPIRFRNLTRNPITVLGAQVGCSCLSIPDLPVAIPGGEVLALEVQFHADFVSKETKIGTPISLHFDIDQPQQVLEIIVTIIPKT